MKNCSFNLYIDNWVFENLLLPHQLRHSVSDQISADNFAFLSSVLSFPAKRIFLAEMDRASFKDYIDGLPDELKFIIIDRQLNAGAEIFDNLSNCNGNVSVIENLPHIVIGKNLKSNFQRLRHDGVCVVDLNNPIERIHSDVLNGINTIHWFKKTIDEFPSNIIIIDDPYFLSGFKDVKEIKRVFWFLKRINAACISIICKAKNIKEDGNNLNYATLEYRKNQFEETIRSLNNNTSVQFYFEAVHDRFISTNNRFFILGNSFNMKDGTSTYVATYDLFEKGCQFF